MSETQQQTEEERLVIDRDVLIDALKSTGHLKTPQDYMYFFPNSSSYLRVGLMNEKPEDKRYVNFPDGIETFVKSALMEDHCLGIIPWFEETEEVVKGIEGIACTGGVIILCGHAQYLDIYWKK